MKKSVLDLTISQNKKKVEVNKWVNTAINAKKDNEEGVSTSNFGKKLQVNMSICKSILYKR